MAPRVGMALALDLIKTPSVGTTAAAIATAAVIARYSPAFCEESSYLDGPEYATAWTDYQTTTGARHLESWEPQLKSVKSVFYPKSVFFTAFRSLVFTLLPVWSSYFQEVERLEDDAFQKGLEPPEVWPPLPTEELQQAGWDSLRTTLRDLATWTLRRLFEARVDREATQEVRNRLLTDFKEVSLEYGRLRKQRGTQISLLCAPAAVDSMLHANVLGAAADCVVSSLLDCYRVIVSPLVRARQQLPAGYIFRRAVRICLANALRCSTSLCCASLGSAFGAWTFSFVNRPYAGAVIVGTAVDLALTFYFVTPLVSDWAFGSLPPPLLPDCKLPPPQRPADDVLPGDNFDLHMD